MSNAEMRNAHNSTADPAGSPADVAVTMRGGFHGAQPSLDDFDHMNERVIERFLGSHLCLKI